LPITRPPNKPSFLSLSRVSCSRNVLDNVRDIHGFPVCSPYRSLLQWPCLFSTSISQAAIVQADTTKFLNHGVDWFQTNASGWTFLLESPEGDEHRWHIVETLHAPPLSPLPSPSSFKSQHRLPVCKARQAKLRLPPPKVKPFTCFAALPSRSGPPLYRSAQHDISSKQDVETGSTRAGTRGQGCQN
jgi:hypothetical protein